ncbi:MAG: hypothetical protein HZA21_04395 [Nitrospirae bacterium]|nr:hypothetical protein [Nitrospirota bacterium]
MGTLSAPGRIEERTRLHTYLEMGRTPAAMAVGLHRSASPRSRALRRNGWPRPKTRRGLGRPPVAGGDRADAAHTRAHACTGTPRVARRLRPEPAWWEPVLRDRHAGDLPEPMAGTLARVPADTPTGPGAHDPLSTAIDALPRGEDRRGQLPDRVTMHDRPLTLKRG